MVCRMIRIPHFLFILIAGALCAQENVTILEGEKLSVLKRSGNPQRQDLRAHGVGRWSEDAHLWWRDARPGDVLELAVPVAVDGEYRIGAGFTKAVDYGIFEFTLDGKPLAGPVDFYNNGVAHTGTIALGDRVTFQAGEHRLGVTVKGANPKAKPSFMLGLDYLVLVRGEGDIAAFGPKLAVAKRSELKTGNAEDAKPLTPAQQRAAFTVPEGFEIELVASEETGLPKPAMVSFDDAGRMWSVTATEYPRDNDPAVWKQRGKDRVVVFDTPTAATPQTPRIFSDGMVMPLSVLPWGKGAIVAQGPDIFYMDGAGERRVLAHGFGVQDTHTLPHQLTQMPGGRIVFSQGVLNDGRMTDAAGKAFAFNKTLVASMKPDGTDTRIIGAGLNNIWSWAHGRTGRVFITEANDLGYSIVPFEEDTSYPSFIATKLHPASPLHPPTAEGLELGGTGFSGLALCDDKSGSFPAPWQGLLYVSNPILGKIHAVSTSLDPRGVWTFKKHGDLVSCTDPMFRPVAITFGPDGCLYITDWYNRIISHNEIARDHPARDKERGRVWRVRHKSQSRGGIADMTNVPTNELPARLAAASTWEMRAAWHQIGQRKARELAPALIAIVGDGKAADDTRIHALWSLEDLGHFDAAAWRKSLGHISPDVRREAVRALTTLRVSENEAFDLLQPLADEWEWTVRYEILRFFRHAAGPVNPVHIAWLRRWSADAAPDTKVKGWNGPFLALGGAYERAFQDFLLSLAETKTPAAALVESQWDKVIATEPAMSPALGEAVKIRVAKTKAALASAKPAEGKPLVETLCLACHSAGGKGISIAPPLDGSASRDTDALITAILAPDEAIEQVFRLYRIETKDGGRFEGFKKNESNKEISLMSMGGATQTVPIANIKSAGYVAGKSFMLPLGAGFSDEQLANVVAYLKTLK